MTNICLCLLLRMPIATMIKLTMLCACVSLINMQTLEESGSAPKEELWGYDEHVLTLKCPEEYQAVNSDDIVVWVDPLGACQRQTGR